MTRHVGFEYLAIQRKCSNDGGCNCRDETRLMKGRVSVVFATEERAHKSASEAGKNIAER